jgi:hypothetical protein
VKNPMPSKARSAAARNKTVFRQELRFAKK